MTPMGSLNRSKNRTRAIQSPLLALQLRALLTQPDFRILLGSNIFSIKEMTKALELNPIQSNSRPRSHILSRYFGTHSDFRPHRGQTFVANRCGVAIPDPIGVEPISIKVMIDSFCKSQSPLSLSNSHCISSHLQLSSSTQL